MNYYEVALLKSPLSPLTYQCEKTLDLGNKVEVKLRNRKILSPGVIVKVVSKPSFKCVDIKEITSFYYDEKMLEISSFISMYYVSSLGEALSLYNPFDKNISNTDQNNVFDSKITLSKEQEKAYDFCQKKQQALLFANTGSGKTEIYIKSIEKHLNNNKQAVLLMPEISLTPQMQKRLENAFGSSVAIWHSKVSKKRKTQIIEGLLEGSIKLIAGARSSLFLPFSNLACIIVDEEHDESYKADSKPRYNLKDLCIYIAKKHNIQAIFGSATPSLSSFHKLPFVRLTQTFYESRKNYYFDEEEGLSTNIINKIHDTLEQKNQVIVFLPTRANYKYQVCMSCGKGVECPFCSVSMSLHKFDKALKCHYCGYAQKIPDTCPSCKNGIITNLRVVTAQIEEELKEIFPSKNIKRFDRDVIKTDKKLRAVLDEFNKEEIDILVGTQMLSKGHDYHNVKLAVIFGIDSVLNMNSYKARERALSLLIQIAGRSGRKGEGDIIVQSKNAHFFQHHLENIDYEDFLKEELEVREDFYPPFLKMAKVIFASSNGLKAQDEMHANARFFKNMQDLEVVGFGPCVIERIANKYRFEIILRSSKVKVLLNALHSINSNIVSIDMDTIS